MSVFHCDGQLQRITTNLVLIYFRADFLTKWKSFSKHSYLDHLNHQNIGIFKRWGSFEAWNSFCHLLDHRSSTDYRWSSPCSSLPLLKMVKLMDAASSRSGCTMKHKEIQKNMADYSLKPPPRLLAVGRGGHHRVCGQRDVTAGRMEPGQPCFWTRF